MTDDVIVFVFVLYLVFVDIAYPLFDSGAVVMEKELLLLGKEASIVRRRVTMRRMEVGNSLALVLGELFMKTERILMLVS